MGQVLFCRGWTSLSARGNWYVNVNASHDFLLTDNGRKVKASDLGLQIVPDKKFHPEISFSQAKKFLIAQMPAHHIFEDFIFRIYRPEGSQRAYAELIGMTTKIPSRSSANPSFLAHLAVQPDEYSYEHKPDSWYPQLISQKKKFEQDAWHELRIAHNKKTENTKQSIFVADEIINGKLSGVGSFRCISGSEKKSFERVESWEGWCFDLTKEGGLAVDVIEISRQEFQAKTLDSSRIAEVREIRNRALEMLTQHTWERSKQRLKGLLANIPYLECICPVLLKKGRQYDRALGLLDQRDKERDLIRV